MSTVASKKGSETHKNNATHKTKQFQALTASDSVNDLTFQPSNGNNSLFDINYVEKELECQICLNPLDRPVLLACGAHSLCYDCFASLFKHQKSWRWGIKQLHCPSCGVNSGLIRLKSLKNLKVNRELERVKKAYEKEKSLWVEEKMRLEMQLSSKQLNKNTEKIEKQKESAKKTLKKGLSVEEEKSLQKILENFEPEKLEEVSHLLSKTIQERQKENSTQVKKKGEKRTNMKSKDDGDISSEKSKETKSKENSLQKKRPLTVVKSKYSLRSLKKTKTANF